MYVEACPADSSMPATKITHIVWRWARTNMWYCKLSYIARLLVLGIVVFQNILRIVLHDCLRLLIVTPAGLCKIDRNGFQDTIR